MDVTEDKTVAKVQRSTQLPSDIFRLIDATERRSGAKFNRQNLAAFLMYFFSSPSGASNKWMEAAVAVERGDISVCEVPNWLAKRKVDDLENLKSRSKKSPYVNKKQLDQVISDAITTQQRWDNIMRLADNPIDAIMAFWERMDSAAPPFSDNFDDLHE